MYTSSDFRAAARQALRGQWTNPVLFTLVYYALTLIPSVACNQFAEGSSLVITIVLLPLGWAFVVAFLQFLRGDARSFEVDRLFDGYKNDATRILFTLILQQVYTLLWTLLFIIPGCIKTYSYAMTPYILKDEPELSNNAAIERSMAMMQGHKWDLFCLHFSFIGWFILAILTGGIGFLWLTPYVSTAQAAFYEELKNSNA